VGSEVFAATEGFPTLVARMRLVCRVNQHMSLEVGDLECADVASHGHLARVKSLVLRELFAQSELAAARRALKRALAAVKQQVVAQKCRDPEPLAAQRTLVAQTGRVRVLAHVLSQQAVQAE